MKKSVEKVLKFILIVFAALCFLCDIVLVTFAVQGAVMYKTAVSGNPVKNAAQEIRARGDYVSYDELPEFYIKAVISVEDRDFMRHGGVDISAICRALIYDIKTMSLDQGGSTITQQLAKNLYFTSEKRPDRKFAEIYAAIELEHKLSKQDIFALYANTIYFGDGYYGISEAAEGYFGKTASELGEYECAVLAGIPQAPSVYCEINSAPSNARLREVLSAMTESGVIDASQADEIAARAG